MSCDRSSRSTTCSTRPLPSSELSTAERLRARPRVQRVPTRELELFILRDFLDHATCAALIERIDANRRPSEISDDLGIANFRTSETCDLDWRDPLVGEVDGKIANLLGLSLWRPVSRCRGNAMRQGKSSSRTRTRSNRAAMISWFTPQTEDSARGRR